MYMYNQRYSGIIEPASLLVAKPRDNIFYLCQTKREHYYIECACGGPVHPHPPEVAIHWKMGQSTKSDVSARKAFTLALGKMCF